MDLRKSTGLLYAKIRRTSGVNHIVSSSHPQSHAVGELNLHRPRPARSNRRLHLDKLPLIGLASPEAAIPFLKRPQRQSFLLTELSTAQPTLPIPCHNLTPLCSTPLHLAITTHLHTFLLYTETNSRVLHGAGTLILRDSY